MASLTGLVLLCSAARPLPSSVHRNTTLHARETAPLPKKQVQATMSCFSGTTFYISHKPIRSRCSTLPSLDPGSSFPMQTGFLGAGAAAFSKHHCEAPSSQLHHTTTIHSAPHLSSYAKNHHDGREAAPSSTAVAWVHQMDSWVKSGLCSVAFKHGFLNDMLGTLGLSALRWP